MIFDKRFRRTTTQTEDNHVLQISEHACQYPTRSQIDIAGAHPSNHLLRHSVHDITDQGDRCYDGRRLVDECLIVTCDRDAWHLAGLLIETIVVITFR